MAPRGAWKFLHVVNHHLVATLLTIAILCVEQRIVCHLTRRTTYLSCDHTALRRQGDTDGCSKSWGLHRERKAVHREVVAVFPERRSTRKPAGPGRAIITPVPGVEVLDSAEVEDRLPAVGKVLDRHSVCGEVTARGLHGEHAEVIHAEGVCVGVLPAHTVHLNETSPGRVAVAALPLEIPRHRDILDVRVGVGRRIDRRHNCLQRVGIECCGGCARPAERAPPGGTIARVGERRCGEVQIVDSVDKVVALLVEGAQCVLLQLEGGVLQEDIRASGDC
eukprot:832802-Prymnesium_polylepis.1